MFVLWLWSFISQPHPLTLQSALLHQCLQFPHYSIAPPFTLQHRLYIRASPFALQPLYITVPLCIQVPVYITVLLLLWCPPFTSQPLLFPSQTSSLYNSVLSSHLTSQSPSSSHQCLLSPLYITAPSLHPSPPLTWSPAPFLAPTDSRPLYSHPYLHLSLLHHPSPLTALLPTTLLQPYQFYLTQRVKGRRHGVPGQRAGAALFMLTGDELLGSAHKKKITSLRTWEVRQLPPSVWTCRAFCHLLAVRMNAVAAVGEMRIWPGLCLDWGPPFSDAWSKY